MKQPQQPRSDVAGSTSHQPSHQSSRKSLGFRSFPFPSLVLPSLLLIPLTLLLLPPQLIAHPVQPNQQTQVRQHRPVASQVPARYTFNDGRMPITRPRRQSRPREGIWQIYLRLMDEGTNDTQSALSQIGQLFSTLIESGTPKENLVSTTENATTAGVGGGEGEDTVDGSGAAENATTTTTTEAGPRKISTTELMGIFRRNVFGLGRLFGREFWNAIQQSNRNIQTYSKQWSDAVRPYLE